MTTPPLRDRLARVGYLEADFTPAEKEALSLPPARQEEIRRARVDGRYPEVNRSTAVVRALEVLDELLAEADPNYSPPQQLTARTFLPPDAPPLRTPPPAPRRPGGRPRRASV